MPTISAFYGILILMFYGDDEQHHAPHIHVQYNEFSASVSIDTGEVLAGEIPRKQLRLVQAWVELRREELYADWKLATQHQTLLRIKPLD
jgi:hypothetical protein